MLGSDLHGSWEISSVPAPPGAGGTGKAQSRNPVVYAGEKSDTPVVPEKPSNKGKPAEMVEERGVAKGNVSKHPAPRTPSRNKVASMGLEGVRIAARRDKTVRFTALLHHITPTLLVESFYALRHDAAAGVDAVTWRDYEEELFERVEGLHREIHTGAYRAKPSRRVHIHKADGRQRPLGIASVEDKVVQQAVVTVLNMIYEEDYLHYAQDQWVQQWRGRHARDKVMIVRYADDSVFGFKREDDTRRFLAAMQERLDKFWLTLNAKKTRLIDFGRFAASTRKRRGQKKPETFDFSGFTHCCSTTRQGLFQVRRLTVKKRMRAKIAEIRVELMRRSQRPRMPWDRFSRIARRFMPPICNAHPYPEERFYASHT
jgi:hypothetical protein